MNLSLGLSNVKESMLFGNPPSSFAFLQNARVDVGTNSCTVPNFSSVGCKLILATVQYFSATAPTLADNLGNTYTRLTVSDNASASVVLFYCISPTTNAVHNVTATVAGGYPTLSVDVFNCSKTPRFLLQNKNGLANSNNLQVGSIVSPAIDNLFYCGVNSFSTAAASSINQSYIITDNHTNGGGAQYAGASAYFINNLEIINNPTFTFSASVPCVAAHALFDTT